MYKSCIYIKNKKKNHANLSNKTISTNLVYTFRWIIESYIIYTYSNNIMYTLLYKTAAAVKCVIYLSETIIIVLKSYKLRYIITTFATTLLSRGT